MTTLPMSSANLKETGWPQKSKFAFGGTDDDSFHEIFIILLYLSDYICGSDFSLNFDTWNFVGLAYLPIDT